MEIIHNNFIQLVNFLNELQHVRRVVLTNVIVVCNYGIDCIAANLRNLLRKSCEIMYTQIGGLWKCESVNDTLWTCALLNGCGIVLCS